MVFRPLVFIIQFSGLFLNKYMSPLSQDNIIFILLIGISFVFIATFSLFAYIITMSMLLKKTNKNTALSMRILIKIGTLLIILLESRLSDKAD